MTREEFNNYRFGVNTVVIRGDEFIGLTEVDFDEGWVRLRGGKKLKYNQIELIAEKIITNKGKEVKQIEKI